LQELITIDTGADGDYLGHDIALSGDGKTMAVGARGARYVRSYGKDGMDWNMFQQVNGNGYAVGLSHDGSILAISAEYGAVYMYELSNTTYLYELIHTTGDGRSARVSVSGDDGSAVGVTYGGNSIFGRIYERIGNGFQQRGSALTGYGRWAGIALNYNGRLPPLVVIKVAVVLLVKLVCFIGKMSILMGQWNGCRWGMLFLAMLVLTALAVIALCRSHTMD